MRAVFFSGLLTGRGGCDIIRVQTCAASPQGTEAIIEWFVNVSIVTVITYIPSGDGNMHILVLSFFDYYVSIYTPKGTEALVEWLVRVSMITVYPPQGTETIINTLFCFI